MSALRKPAKFHLMVGVLLSVVSTGAAQVVNREKIAEQLQKDGCARLPGDTIKVCKYDYRVDGKQIEAITIRPIAEGKYPGVVLLPARSTAITNLTLATILANHGFASLSISDIGFGKSEGKSDFMGPATIRAFAAGFRKFEREPFIDSKRMGLFGYSRGGMAASLLTITLGKDVKAAVFGSGVYDFRRAYEETKIEGIRENMKAETGMTEVAIR
ncbi:MAG: alpha/beta hydrolase family protein, partial [Pyrinomonadaceae bacterium]